MFLKKFNKYLHNLSDQGQHLIEYTTLLIIIAAAVITMGPYVIRSWNAKVKGWEDSHFDSFFESFQQASGDPLIFCQEPGWREAGCFRGYAGENCNEFEMLYVKLCNPIGCCVSMPGQIIIPEAGLPYTGPINVAKCVEDPRCCGPETKGKCGKEVENIPVPPGCQDIEAEFCKICGGSAIPVCRCGYDLSCDPLCLDAYEGIEYSQEFCPGDRNMLEPPGVVTTYVTSLDDCTDEKKCEMICNCPFVGRDCAVSPSYPDGICLECGCPLGSIYDPETNTCYCAEGYVLPSLDDCLPSPPLCEQNGCNANECPGGTISGCLEGQTVGYGM